MRIDEAQADVRRVYRGGFVGQLVSGALWLIAAAVASRVSPGASIATLFLGGMLILVGVLLLLWLPVGAPLGGWFTGALLVLFAFLLRASSERRGLV